MRSLVRLMGSGLSLAILLAGCVRSARQRDTIELPGIRADGRVQLPNQWSLKPAGKSIELGDFPVNIAVHPSGAYLAILHAGYSTHEIVIVDVSSADPRVASRSSIEVGFYGLCFSPNGAQLFCSGASKERIEAFAFQDGLLSDHRSLPVGLPLQTCVPAGLAISADGNLLYIAGNRGHLLGVIPTQGEGSPLRVALPAESFPYGCVLDEAHQKLYVSLWGAAHVAVFDLPIRADSKVAALWATEDHPNEMVLTRDAATLFVANANRNTVSVIDTATGQTREVISSALYAGAPNGSTPNSIALTPDEGTLFIANADNNNLAVIDVSQPGHSRPRGFIPVGWYPTSVRVGPHGRRVFVTNGKGAQSKPNPSGPNPMRRAKSTEEYIASLFRGTLTVLDVPNDEQLREFSQTAYACSPLRADRRPVIALPAGSPIPDDPGEHSPIKYCVYIVKENRTYDQVLGDMREGNGDPGLCIFGEQVTPNHHALAREFVLLDNFYVEAEVSADGHEWSMGAYASDFVEKSWPLNYGSKSFGRIPYPSEGDFKIAAPSEGYIWDRCAQAGVSYRSYGEFVQRRKGGELFATVETLKDHFDPQFEPFNLAYSDRHRAERFITELQRFEAEGEMPRFQVVRLPNDHTEGTRVGKPTPIAMVAENDLALGQVVEALSHSKFWAEMAIFVVEDDAQNGADHIDAHRTIAYVISPYARRGFVDSSLYSTTSMLRTMELILGLKPMSQFDAAARPMYASFQPRPNPRPYRCRPATADLEAKNDATAWGADISEGLDLSKEDAADDLLFNDIIWRSVRGPNSPMPPPVRAAFVLGSHDADGDDDD